MLQPLVILLFALLVAACNPKANEATTGTNAKEQARKAIEAAETKRAAAVKECEDSRGDLIKAYDELTRKGQHWEAARHITHCANTTADKDLESRIAEAEIRSFKQEADDAKLPPRTRAAAAQKLVDHYPAAGAKYEKKIPEWIAAADRQERAAEAKRRRSEGVHIGMTKDDVLASSWGRPQSINTTTTQFGTREQWVYGGRNFLYFTDGKLTAIQN